MKCTKNGCNAEGDWCPVLLLYAPAKYGNPNPYTAQVQGIFCCEEHKAKATFEDFVDDGCWAMICASLQQNGKVAPDRKLARLDWRPWKGSVLQRLHMAQTN